jgi:cyclohexanone monooxygenase
VNDDASNLASTAWPQKDADFDVDVDAVVVGAGFSGLYMLYRLRELGLTARLFERGSGIGGTWFWNRYPGAKCDAESLTYSYSFSADLEQEWSWSQRYAPQSEILDYLNHVADRFDLRRDITLQTAVSRAVFEESSNRWIVTTDTDEIVHTRFCIMATGCLSNARVPAFPGLDIFEGATYHTGAWPPDGVDFTGLRVGLIGTGSTGIQATPVIAAQAAHLTVFQRTPNFSVPAENGPIDPALEAKVKAHYPELREKARHSGGGGPHDPPTLSALEVSEEERQAHYEQMWSDGGPTIMMAYADIMSNKAANDTLADFIRAKIAAIVDDPEVADLLKPHDHAVGTKRICVDTDYYATFNKDHVDLVDVRRHPILEITATGLRTDTTSYDLDVLVMATGFDAMTGALNGIDILGREGDRLRDHWSEGPKTYLGLAVTGFPNLYLITGPGSPSVLTNMATSIEQHVEWIAAQIDWLRHQGATVVEATPEAQEKWVEHVNAVADLTLYPQANSWYMGSNIPGKPRVFMPYVGGVGPYRAQCDEIAANAYSGFDIS